MSLFDSIKLAVIGSVGSGVRPQYGYLLRTPESSEGLEGIIYDEAMKPREADLDATEDEAMMVPAISRAMDLYDAALSQMEPHAEGGELPEWLGLSDGPITPAHRLSAIVRDLIFHGTSCLAVSRDVAGTVTNGIHIPRNLWNVDADGAISVEGKPVSPDEVLFFHSFKRRGLLHYGRVTISHYAALGSTIKQRARTPKPVMGIRVTDDRTAKPEEVKQAQQDFAAARRAPDGAVVIIPPGIEIQEFGGDDDAQMLIEARNAARLDAANFMNMPAALLDGNSGTTDQYSNTLQNANEFITLSVNLWLRAVEARLSQDDVTPFGVKISYRSATLDAFTPAVGNQGTATTATPERTTA